MQGLTRDDDNLHDDRIRLWDEFNRAWLVTLQTQFDMTQEWVRTAQPVREPRSIMNAQILEHLSRELVRLCDSVEKHGLVDYQMGVAEEEIMDRKSAYAVVSRERGADHICSASAMPRSARSGKCNDWRRVVCFRYHERSMSVSTETREIPNMHITMRRPQ